MLRWSQTTVAVTIGGVLLTSLLVWILFPLEGKNQDINEIGVEDIEKYLGLVQSTSELIKSYRSKRERLLQKNTNVENETVPSTQYETLRRDIRSNVMDMSEFTKCAIMNLTDQLVGVVHKDVRLRLLDLLKLSEEHKQWLLSDIDILTDYDGYGAWRNKESRRLSQTVQGRLKYLQNPMDCSKHRKLVCKLPPDEGFAEQVHNIAYCLIVAYGRQRTLIIDGSDWKDYDKLWGHTFLPLSIGCHNWEGHSQKDWPDVDKVQVVFIRNVTTLLSEHPPYIPLSVPKDLATRLERLHGDPALWWIGQMVKYVLRPTTHLQMLINKIKKEIGDEYFVGVHFEGLRNDVGNYKIDEYMNHVDDYFSQLEMTKLVERNIFLSTRDLEVIKNINISYPYEIFRSRIIYINNTQEELGVDIDKSILDILLLANSHRLVCSFSSEKCRLAYEMMQALHVDATFGCILLDSRYYFKGHPYRYQKVVIRHEPKSSDEIQVIPGDILRATSKNINGFSNCKNLRTLKSGLVPNYKIKNLLKIESTMAYYEEIH